MLKAAAVAVSAVASDAICWSRRFGSSLGVKGSSFLLFFFVFAAAEAPAFLRLRRQHSAFAAAP